MKKMGLGLARRKIGILVNIYEGGELGLGLG